MQRYGNSFGKGAGCPTRFLLSPLNVHTPFVHALNSSDVISDILLPLVFFHSSLYKTTINSTGAITTGAEADFQLPHAVLREMLPSFQTIVDLYFQPTFCAIFVKSAPTARLPPLFLSNGMFRQKRACALLHLKQFDNHCSEKFRYCS